MKVYDGNEEYDVPARQVFQMSDKEIIEVQKGEIDRLRTELEFAKGINKAEYLLMQKELEQVRIQWAKNELELLNEIEQVKREYEF